MRADPAPAVLPAVDLGFTRPQACAGPREAALAAWTTWATPCSRW